MRFENMTGQQQVYSAIRIADYLISEGSDLIRDLRLKNDFQYDSGDGLDVAKNLLIERKPIKVFTYKSKLPWSKAIGYFDGKAIHLNMRKLPYMNTVDIVANLIHEYAHYCGFSHGNNYKTDHKVNFSVPYWLSNNVNRWIK